MERHPFWIPTDWWKPSKLQMRVLSPISKPKVSFIFSFCFFLFFSPCDHFFFLSSHFSLPFFPLIHLAYTHLLTSLGIRYTRICGDETKEGFSDKYQKSWQRIFDSDDHEKAEANARSVSPFSLPHPSSHLIRSSLSCPSPSNCESGHETVEWLSDGSMKVVSEVLTGILEESRIKVLFSFSFLMITFFLSSILWFSLIVSFPSSPSLPFPSSLSRSLTLSPHLTSRRLRRTYSSIQLSSFTLISTVCYLPPPLPFFYMSFCQPVCLSYSMNFPPPISIFILLF